MLSPATKSRRVQTVSLTLAFLVSLPVRAGVIPGRWESERDSAPSSTPPKNASSCSTKRRKRPNENAPDHGDGGSEPVRNTYGSK